MRTQVLITSVYLGLDFQSVIALQLLSKMSNLSDYFVEICFVIHRYFQFHPWSTWSTVKPAIKYGHVCCYLGIQICAHCPACRNNSRNGTLYHRDVIEIATAWAGLKSM